MGHEDMRHHTTGFEIREIGTSSGIFTGYASVFNELIESYNEIVDPGAFTQTLKHNDGKVPVLWLHGEPWGLDHPPIGMGQSAEENDRGLLVTAKLDIKNNELARSTWGFMLLAKEVNRRVGLSIGFNPVTTLESEDEPSHHKEIRLWEYSVTPPDWQAGPSAGVDEMRSSAQNQVRSYLGTTDGRDFIVSCLTTMGVKTPALEAARATQGATTPDEAQLHSLAETLRETTRKLIRS